MAVTIFLKLTDYIDALEFGEITPEALQTIVCGSDGFRLERIRQLSGVEMVRFVSAPFPGFYVKGRMSANVSVASNQLKAILEEIRKAILDKSSTCSNSSTAAPKAPVAAKAKRSRGPSYKNTFYHPLYSENQYHLMPGLLPTPTASSQESTTPQPLSDEDCERILSSPYLVGIKNRASPSSATSAKDVPSFDKELEGCLPGVPGVRQSKEYKRIRRKISEIDDLVASGAELDTCQRAKVSRRAEYVAQIRDMLLNGIPEEVISSEVLVEESVPAPEVLAEVEVESPPSAEVHVPEVLDREPSKPPTGRRQNQRKKQVCRPKNSPVIKSQEPPAVSTSMCTPPQLGIEEYILGFLGFLLGLLVSLRSAAARWGAACAAFFIGDTEEAVIVLRPGPRTHPF